MISTVILDLDGPILDGHLRHYACYQQICDKYGWPTMCLAEYWQAKRERRDVWTHAPVTATSSPSEVVRQEWRDRIELPDLLALDAVQPGAPERLAQWRYASLRLVLVTSRRFRDRLLDQLIRLGLDAFWDCIVTSDPAGGGTEKARRVKHAIPHASPERCAWIGDTEADIEAGRAFGCRVWAVTSGLRTRSYLLSLAPDFLSANLAEVDLGVTGRRPTYRWLRPAGRA